MSVGRRRRHETVAQDEARVVAAVYLGAFSSYRCRLEGCGTELVVRAPNPQGAVTGPRFAAGEAVGLTIAPGGLRALRA